MGEIIESTRWWESGDRGGCTLISEGEGPSRARRATIYISICIYRACIVRCSGGVCRYICIYIVHNTIHDFTLLDVAFELLRLGCRVG